MKYGVIYADPPWSFSVYDEKTGWNHIAAIGDKNEDRRSQTRRIATP